MKRAAVALVLLLTIAGCKTPEAAPASPPTTTVPVGPAAIEWADRMCAAILEFDSSAPASEMDAGSQAAMISWLTSYLDATSARITTAVGKLQDLGPAPVAGGDEAAASIIGALQNMGAVVSRSKERLNGVNRDDPAATRSVLTEIANDLQGLRTPVNPLEGMGARYPDLQAAARSADNCTEVTRQRASRTAYPPMPSSSGYPTTTPSGPTTETTTTTTTTTPPTETSYPTF